LSRKGRLGALIVGVAVVLAALVPLYQRVMGPKRLRFPYLARPIADGAYAALAAKPGWSKTELEVAPGTKLNGLLRRPSSSTAPWVLFYPGNDESQLERGQGFLIRLAADLDFGLAVFAYRGYDSSHGKAEHAALVADAPEILTKLCAAEGIPASRVHLAGFSIGGHVSTHAARSAALSGKRAASLTLFAPVSDIVMYQPSPWEKLSPGEDYLTLPLLPEIPAPVLVLQGGADRTLDNGRQGQAIAAALGQRAEYREFAGVDHVPLLSFEPALVAMRTFVQKVAQDPPPAK
jgi:pimeloyl-ACP methyl ester carboxylesterase